MATTKTISGKVVWLGNGVAKYMQPTKGGDPIAVGGTITLTQAQVTALEAAGHRFAKPGSDDAQQAQDQSAVAPPVPVAGDTTAPAG